MQTNLVVVRPFGPHAVGDRISEPEVVAAILASDHASAVVAVSTSAPTPALASITEH